MYELFDKDALEEYLYTIVTEGNGRTEEELESMSDAELGGLVISNWSDLALLDELMREIDKNLEVKYYLNDKEVQSLGNLKQGDKITVKATANDLVLEDINMKLVDGEYEFTVGELKEGKEYKVFDYVDISCSGISGSATIDVQWKESVDLSADIQLSVETDGPFKNGDTVVIKAIYDEDSLSTQGYYITKDTMEYKVSGLGEYAGSASDIPESLKNIIKKEAISKMENAAPGFNLSFHKMYLGVPENQDDYRNNIVIVIMKGTDPDTKEKVNIYCYYSNVVALEDGKYLIDDLDDITHVYSQIGMIEDVSDMNDITKIYDGQKFNHIAL